MIGWRGEKTQGKELQAKGPICANALRLERVEERWEGGRTETLMCE